MPILGAWAQLCGSDVSALPHPHARSQAVRGLLAKRVAERGRLMVVLDDVREEWLDGARVLGSARPPGVPLLLTTRAEELALALNATVRRLDVLPPDEALKLLRTLAGPVVTREQDAARRLAERVGRLPLALELAGKLAALRARKPGFRLADLCAQVEARTAETLQLTGQRGLAACFSLSYETLDAESQRLFCALSVFAPAPFTAAHVAGVLGWEQGTAEARLDGLVALALARWTDARTHRPEEPVLGRAEEPVLGRADLPAPHVYSGDDTQPPAPPVPDSAAYILHPLMRDYAAVLLEQTGAAPSTQAAHTAHYLAYAESHDQPTAADYDRLQAEHHNILAAMDRAYRQERWAQVRSFAWALCRPVDGYLGVRGYWGELRARLEQAIRAAEAEG
ncbi:MAG: hypothetical protein GY831_26400, partial [Delftia sp.]|nr:hypothetical protein [Delftia sp.]